VINLITRISVVGISVITASLIILLSAFNGIESMIEKLYSDFDTDITIRSTIGKTFPEDLIDYKSIQKTTGVTNYTKAIEEIVVIKHEKKFINASLVGVDSSFLKIARMEDHMVDGKPILVKKNHFYGLIGATLLDNLGGYIPKNIGFEQVILYVPKRDSKVRIGSNPFNTKLIDISGRMNFNREVNADKLVVPIELAKDILNYKKDITAIYIDVDPSFKNEDVKASLSELLGTNFIVKTNYEKNELIYKTSKSEKIIVLIILLFIFILAAFNLIASLTMLFVEKKDNIQTMINFGANKKTIFNIFFFEGLLISGKGIIIGLVLGYGICLLQIKSAILTMPNSGGEAFPINTSFTDGLLILFLISFLSFLFSYFPVRFLIKKNLSHLNF
jgi:lipoprotein-releasing system permease protein